MTGKPTSVGEYIASLEGWQAEAVASLRQIVLDAVPGAAERFKWAQPVYESNGPFCYIKAFKRHVNFGFWWGLEIDDPLGLLQGSGDKMRHVKITTLADIQPDALKSLAKASAEANQRLGDPTKKATG
jgi:hypothetical protein